MLVELLKSGCQKSMCRVLPSVAYMAAGNLQHCVALQWPLMTFFCCKWRLLSEFPQKVRNIAMWMTCSWKSGRLSTLAPYDCSYCFYCIFTLRAKLNGTVYCNRSCLWVCLSVCVCLWVCYHDNLKLRASIFTKLGL